MNFKRNCHNEDLLPVTHTQPRIQNIYSVLSSRSVILFRLFNQAWTYIMLYLPFSRTIWVHKIWLISLIHFMSISVLALSVYRFERNFWCHTVNCVADLYLGRMQPKPLKLIASWQWKYCPNSCKFLIFFILMMNIYIRGGVAIFYLLFSMISL